AAGAIGSIVGIGGGLLVTPVLTLIFGVDIHLAIGASIIAIIATSSGGAVAYIRDRITNIRVGMYLEIGTTLGAITGAALAAYANSSLLFGFFGLVLLASVVPLLRKRNEELPVNIVNDRLATRLHLSSSYPDQRLSQEVSYNVKGSYVGLGIMYGAGLLSGLLGIGSGAFKVLGMENAMRLPMKVSTTTSNFMIGVTAAASAGIYFVRGDVNPFIVAPVVLGVLGGAMVGTKILVRARNTTVRMVFIVVLFGISIEMIAKAIGILP
ncbi:MAG: sulfite exporter TauE/SafE family protein, partial [Thaumarchaeota archaeon]|nr:sulfite exporter TauE/SafE family protein [Nitrososphaerota archaeon]